LELILGQGYEISGRIVVDGPNHLDFSKVILQFASEPAKIDSTGTFRANVGNGEVGYMIQGLPEDWYVKDFTVQGRRIVGRAFQLQPGQTEVVLALSPTGGRVEIVPSGAGDINDVMRAAAVALLPENGIVDVNSMFVAEGGDPSGKFILTAFRRVTIAFLR
jgi:hypothetical protein